MSVLFGLSNLLIGPFWLLMILAPRWRVTERVVRSPWIALPSALLYLLLVIPRLAEILPAVITLQLDGIAALLATPAGVVIAWTHIVGFDLFVGRWIYLDGRARGISSWWLSPILVVALLLGPLGLTLYLARRSIGPESMPPSP